MASRRVLVDVEEFNRRRGVAALVRGDSLDLEEVPPRPNAAIAVGVVLALLICGASVAGAYLTGRAPDGWRDDGSLVVDRQTGARFVAQDGLLRPSPTLTGALLAGARSEPVLVPHAVLADAPVGPPLPGQDLPERPPALPAVATGFTACTSADTGADADVQVWAGAPAATPSGDDGVLVQAAGSGVTLVTGRRAYPISEAALVELGYSEAQVRPVPAAWLALVPPGPALDQLALPAPDPSRGVPGIGTVGEVVEAEQSLRRFVVGAGSLAPVVNRTSELLAPAPARSLPDAVLLGAPAAPPVGVVDAPTIPPRVPLREAVVVACVRSSDGLVQVEAAVDDGARPSPARTVDVAGTPVTTVWHLPPGTGALVGPTTLDQPTDAGSDQGTGGIRLVDDGVGYEVADLPALAALGYRRDQTVLLPDAWLALLAPGGRLATSR